MNPELAVTLNLLKPLIETEIERLQTLIDTEEEKEDIDDEKVEKLTDQMNSLEDLLGNTEAYEELTKD